jgi:hypothetical protein
LAVWSLNSARLGGIILLITYSGLEPCRKMM